MTYDYQLEAWRRLSEKLAKHPPGSARYRDPVFQDVLQQDFDAAYNPEWPGQAEARREIAKLNESIPPGTQAYKSPAHQERLRELYRMAHGDKPAPGTTVDTNL